MSEARAGDAIDMQRRLYARTAAMGILIACLGMVTGTWNLERGCIQGCGEEVVYLIGLPITFGAIGCYTGARGGWLWSLSGRVAGAVLFAISVLHLATAEWTTALHLYGLSALTNTFDLFGFVIWWSLILLLGVCIWEGVRMGVDRATGIVPNAASAGPTRPGQRP